MTELVDFNDLQTHEGAGPVAVQVEAGISAALSEPSPAPLCEMQDLALMEPVPLSLYDEYPFESADTPRSPSGPGGAKPRGMSVPSLPELIDHFALIYGTDTVFDSSERMIMKVSNLAQLVGRESMKLWQASPRRRVVRRVVFDPMGRYDPETHENLYDGLPFAVGDGDTYEGLSESVKPILNHIWWMCEGIKGDKEDVYRWLVKWIAYPLQLPGTKMSTSVMNYGIEGTGKSFLWEQVVKRMYGRYGITVGQAQLESAFTTWKSHKLFVVAEEVVSRAEKSHYKGQLKHMITGESHIINEKNLPEREEDNLMNFVFLSNNTQPLDVDHGDRRYLTLFMGEPQLPAYYEKLGKWLANGGAELFYRYLMQLPLGDFGPHAKPPMTESKDGLISLAMPSPQYFFKEWSRGDLGVALSPCVNDDVYQFYTRWCERSGEYRMAKRKFSGELKRFMAQESTKIQYPEAGSAQVSKRVWLPRDWKPREGVGKLEHIGELCRLFKVEMLRYLEGRV